jgi:hypothetical protein
LPHSPFLSVLKHTVLIAVQYDKQAPQNSLSPLFRRR